MTSAPPQHRQNFSNNSHPRRGDGQRRNYDGPPRNFHENKAHWNEHPRNRKPYRNHNHTYANPGYDRPPHGYSSQQHTSQRFHGSGSGAYVGNSYQRGGPSNFRPDVYSHTGPPSLMRVAPNNFNAPVATQAQLVPDYSQPRANIGQGNGDAAVPEVSVESAQRRMTSLSLSEQNGVSASSVGAVVMQVDGARDSLTSSRISSCQQSIVDGEVETPNSCSRSGTPLNAKQQGVRMSDVATALAPHQTVPSMSGCHSSAGSVLQASVPVQASIVSFKLVCLPLQLMVKK